MILIPKLCFAIAIVSLFRLAQTNEQEVLEFLLSVGYMDRQVNQGAPGAAVNMAQYFGSKETKGFIENAKNTIYKVCNRHLRDLLLKQLLELSTAVNQGFLNLDDAEFLTRYQGCIAATITRKEYPNLNEHAFDPSRCDYFSGGTDELLGIVAKLVRQGVEQIEENTAAEFAKLRIMQQNIMPVGQQRCLIIEEHRENNQKAAQLAPACDFIKEALNSIDYSMYRKAIESGNNPRST